MYILVSLGAALRTKAQACTVTCMTSDHEQHLLAAIGPRMIDLSLLTNAYAKGGIVRHLELGYSGQHCLCHLHHAIYWSPFLCGILVFIMSCVRHSCISSVVCIVRVNAPSAMVNRTVPLLHSQIPAGQLPCWYHYLLQPNIHRQLSAVHQTNVRLCCYVACQSLY